MNETVAWFPLVALCVGIGAIILVACCIAAICRWLFRINEIVQKLHEINENVKVLIQAQNSLVSAANSANKLLNEFLSRIN